MISIFSNLALRDYTVS